jgi:transposase
LDPMTTARVYVGVDVSKDRLDVCVRRGEAQRHNDTSFVVAHDDAGIETLVSCLLEKRPELVIIEATLVASSERWWPLWPPRAWP